MVLVLSLSIAYMFLSINMQENMNPPAINITNNETNNAETIDQSHYEIDYSSDPMAADTERYLDERTPQQMHSMDEVPSGEREVHSTEDGRGWYEYYD